MVTSEGMLEESGTQPAAAQPGEPGSAPVAARPSVSARIVAAGIVIAFCYWAGSVVMTLLTAVMVAYFLDPAVDWLERFRMPRVIGSLVIVLVGIAVMATLLTLAWLRINDFATDWPKYSGVIQEGVRAVDDRVRQIERRVFEITPEAEKPAEAPAGTPWVRNLLFRGLGGLYSLLLAAAFLPFLVFFMLAGKRTLWHATLQLFPQTKRTRVKRTLDDVGLVLRGYVVGNALIALILSVASIIFFWAIGLDYAFLVGVVSGFLNLVPYFGVVMAMIPPMIVGLAKFQHIGPFLGIAGMIGFFHMIALNALYPALVGRKVHLNALAVTVALLFWGWLWGALGFLLAIPITATIKVICDHVDGWEPAGRWLGA